MGFDSTAHRQYLGALGANLASIRLADEDALILSFGAHGSTHDCPDGFVSVTAEKAGETATSKAIHLQDALLLVRAKLDRQIEAREKAKEEAKAKSTTAKPSQEGGR